MFRMNKLDETIEFLEDIAKQCDDKATAMVEAPGEKSTEKLDAMVYSGMIINVHLYIKQMINKLEEYKKDMEDD